jgi:hypothetical protein
MSAGADDITLAVIGATAAFAGAALGSLVSLLTTERRIAIENVTQERAKWREEIRENAETASAAIRLNDTAKRQVMRSKFALLLNPHDREDVGILEALVATTPDAEAQVRAFTDRVSLLLKHDWERAKREASLWRRILQREPSRFTFREFQQNPYAAQYRVLWWRWW